MDGGSDTRMDLVLRNRIDDLENAMLEQPGQIDIASMDVRHHFTNNGLYAREMIIPKGTLITGRIKKHEHISVLSAGFVTEVTEAGIQHIRAPYTMVSLPGTKRAVLAHEETVWVTIHLTTKKDLVDIEEELIANSHEDMPKLVQQLELELEDSL